jgi:hypothetical protein
MMDIKVRISMSKKSNVQSRGMPAHWYKLFSGECPLCGSSTAYRVRQYGPKPENHEDRYVSLPYNETYDHCDVGIV